MLCREDGCILCEGVKHFGAPAVLSINLEALGFIVVGISFQESYPFEDVGVALALFHLLAGCYLPMAFLPRDAFALLVLDAAAAYPCFVPSGKEFARNLLACDINGEAVVVCFEEDCPLGSCTVCLGDIICLVSHDVCVDKLRCVVAGGGPWGVGRCDIEVAREQLAVELEGIFAGHICREARQLLYAAGHCGASYIETCLGESH